MNVKKAKIVAIVAAIAAAVLMLLFLKTVQDGQPKYVAVLEAAQQINKGDAMNSVNFTQANVEETSVAPGAVLASDVESIKNMYAAADIYAGEQITRQRLTSEQPSADDIEDGTSLADSIPDGMRTFTMTVSQPTQSASNMIRPGDTIDLLAYYTDLTGQATKEKYVADALTVAAVDQYTESQEKAAQQAAQANNANSAGMGVAGAQGTGTQGTGADGTAQGGTQSSSSQADASQGGQSGQTQSTSGTENNTTQATSYATVTLIVTPDQAKQLNYLQNYGATLTLTLRGKDDKANADHGEFKFEGVSGL